MFFKSSFEILILTNLLLPALLEDTCTDLKPLLKYKFYLWKSKQRSYQERLFVDNVDNLKACVELANKFRGLALNFSPKERFFKTGKLRIISRDHYWQQPQLFFNCHILKCPENHEFKTMDNDPSFDYYSLYDKPIESSDYTCVPEVGLFKLHTIVESYQNASQKCRRSENYCGSLAHVISQKRTEALTRLIKSHNEETALQIKPKVYQAYVGLQYNSTLSHSVDFFNDEKESLKSFAFRAWEPGNPKLGKEFKNSSCVALTTDRSWKTVQCDRKLPFICEIWTSCGV